MTRIRALLPGLALVLLGASLGACGGEGENAGGADRPSIVVTTTILGDVTASLVGDAAEVIVLMPVGASPHDFQPSARQVRAVNEADLVIVNGAGFEEGLLDVIEAAAGDGVPVHEAISAVDTLEHHGHDHGDAESGADAGPEVEEHEDGEGHDHDHDADDDHGDGHGEGHQHGAGGVDPHFFTDPARMTAAARAMAAEIRRIVPSLDTEEVRGRMEDHLALLDSLDREVERILEPVAPEDRLLAVNHDVLGYFADRYGFDVVGSVIPTGSTSSGASAGQIHELADVLLRLGVRAVFTDSSSPDGVARTVADEAGGLPVVALFTESLGGPGSGAATYPEMMRTNATLIAEALTR